MNQGTVNQGTVNTVTAKEGTRYYRLTRGGHFVVLAALLVLFSEAVSAQSIIKDDGGSPRYRVDVEPHAVLTPFAPPNGSSDGGLGAGVMIGINLAERGFLPQVNDTVDLAFGVDWVNYFGGNAVAGECREWIGEGNERICVSTVGGSAAGTYFLLPVVMRWKFYLTEAWSVFGEPGLAPYFWVGGVEEKLRFSLAPVFNVGGKWHFSERASLALRFGYPVATVGVSFYL